MMRPIAIFVGLRYLRTQHGNQFASFVSLASAVGVALGVAALIIVLSVMNGFANELRSRLTSLTGHGWVGSPQGLADWEDVRKSLLDFPGIRSATPMVELEAVIGNGSELAPAIVTGIATRLESADSALLGAMREGSFDSLGPGTQHVLLGEGLAARLGVRPGDQVTVLIPRKDPVHGLQTRLRRYAVTGIFELGVKDHDSVRALVDLEDAAALGGMEGRVSSIRITTADIFSAPTTLRSWYSSWMAHGGGHLQLRDWTQDHATYFRAVRLERVMMIILLSLIVGVAAFNIVATLVMVVTDKRSGIAIMRTFGYARADIVRIFAVQGLVVGWVGVLAGTFAGVLLAVNVDRLAPGLERLFGFQFMPADVYYLTSLPSELHWWDVAVVSLIALLLTAVATVYPAFRAAGVQPAEVLRYE